MGVTPAKVGLTTRFRQVRTDVDFIVSVPVGMMYDADDPYAVHLVFVSAHDDEPTISWSFARELLTEGLDQRTGLGDVKVWPHATARGDMVYISLSSPDGTSVFEVLRVVITRFLKKTYLVVPRGAEGQHVNVDDWIAGMRP